MQHKLFARYPIGNPRRKWKQDNFVLSIANPGPMGLDIADEFTLRKVRRAVKTCTDAGFNLLECLWASPAVGMEIVRTAESVGNRVVFQDLKRFGVWVCVMSFVRRTTPRVRWSRCVRGAVLRAFICGMSHVWRTRCGRHDA